MVVSSKKPSVMVLWDNSAVNLIDLEPSGLKYLHIN